MQLFCTNNDVFTKGRDEFPLLDSKLLSMLIYSSETEGVCIELVFDVSHRLKRNRMKLVFKRVLQYSFYYDLKFSFYYVERFKFFPLNDKGQFYLSLAPIDEDEIISEEDEDIIISENVALFYQ